MYYNPTELKWITLQAVSGRGLNEGCEGVKDAIGDILPGVVGARSGSCRTARVALGPAEGGVQSPCRYGWRQGKRSDGSPVAGGDGEGAC